MSGEALSQWQSDVRLFGEPLGRSDEGERLLIEWDCQAARVRRLVERTGVRPCDSARVTGQVLHPVIRSPRDARRQCR
jgi:hypothetical protein